MGKEIGKRSMRDRRKKERERKGKIRGEYREGEKVNCENVRRGDCGNYINNRFLIWTICIIKTSVLPTSVPSLSMCVGALGLGRDSLNFQGGRESNFCGKYSSELKCRHPRKRETFERELKQSHT